MSIKLKNIDIVEIQEKYNFLINYQSDDPTDPIDPIIYIDSGGDSLLHISSRRGDLKTVALLVEAGMDINTKGDMGYTPLHYAYKGKDAATIKFLLDHGASVEIKNDFGKLPGER